MSDGVCILGMMRTGTSAVAGILEALGVFFGRPERLLAPNPANPTGFREHTEIIAVNDALLAHHGGTWFSPPPLAEGWEGAEALGALRERAAAIVRDELTPAGRWGWKDPRTCLTLPFWQTLAPQAVYVICIRNPVEAARSLADLQWARDRIADPYTRALDLWERYTSEAFARTAGRRRELLLYDELLDDVDAAVARLAALAGLEDQLAGDVERAIAAFVRPSLRHQRAAPPDESEHPANALYAALRAGATSERW